MMMEMSYSGVPGVTVIREQGCKKMVDALITKIYGIGEVIGTIASRYKTKGHIRK